MDDDGWSDGRSLVGAMKFSLLGMLLLGVAWLFGPAIVVSWPLVLLACAVQLRGLVRGSTPVERRASAFTLGAILLLTVLPFWGSHLGEPPRPGHSEDRVPHAHALWELGHVH